MSYLAILFIQIMLHQKYKTAMIQQRNEYQDDLSWATVGDLKIQVAESDIGDVTFSKFV